MKKGMYEGNVPKKANPGVMDAAQRNPNKSSPVNDAPDGPYGPLMGYDGHGGMHGDQSVSGKNGATFNFK